MDTWLQPDLSLCSELLREADRRAIPKLERQDLEGLADRLLIDWYRQQALIDSCLRRVRSLEVQLALATNPQPLSAPKQHHRQWAAELLAKLRKGPTEN